MLSFLLLTLRETNTGSRGFCKRHFQEASVKHSNDINRLSLVAILLHKRLRQSQFLRRTDKMWLLLWNTFRAWERNVQRSESCSHAWQRCKGPLFPRWQPQECGSSLDPVLPGLLRLECPMSLLRARHRTRGSEGRRLLGSIPARSEKDNFLLRRLR